MRSAIEAFVKQYGQDPKYRRVIPLLKEADQEIRRATPEGSDSPGKQEAKTAASTTRQPGANLSDSFAKAASLAKARM